MIGSIVFAFFLVITLLSSLSQIGINTELLESSFILILGGIIVAFSIGYGLASKEVLSNLISSFYMKQRFQVGQVIKIGEVKGEIIKIDKLSLTIENEESIVSIPFRDFQTEKVEIFNFD
jgi:small-conductance mechanosensitive channel